VDFVSTTMITRRHLLLAAALAACAPVDDGADPSCTGDKCDDVDTPAPRTACDDAFVDLSGRATRVEPGSLDDAIARTIFKSGDDCPLSFPEVVAKMRATDRAGCEAGGGAGMKTRLVSERSQILGRPDSYRAVTSRECGGRRAHALLFSSFGLTPDGGPPEDIEIVALDEARGVYNYYVIEDGRWSFHGDSRDMLLGPGARGERRCAGCHVGGGLVMKELESPWMHWEGDTTTPGAAELVARHAELFGQKSTGVELETTVRAGNAIWNKARLAALRKRPVAELLRPLFCTVGINLHNGSTTTSPVSNEAAPSGELSRVPADFLVDTALGFFSAPPVDAADYRALVAANGQRIAGAGDAPLRAADGKPALDSIFDFAFPKRAIIDATFVDELVAAGILDADLVKDVLAVDFTRPIFSDDRCELLDFAPVLDEAQLTAAAVRAGFVAKLRGAAPAAGTPAAQLLALLEEPDDDHAAPVRAFFDACAARDRRDLLADVMQVSSLRRDQARRLQVMEFPETLPFDALSVPEGTRLDPRTCTLTRAFVAP
jgi:hypothetical protein